MQRILSTRSPKEAAKMNGFVSIVLFFPRYMLVAGLTVLALAYFMPQLRAMGDGIDFELILPYALGNFVPIGLLGILMAGLLAAFMSTFAATVNAALACLGCAPPLRALISLGLHLNLQRALGFRNAQCEKALGRFCEQTRQPSSRQVSVVFDSLVLSPVNRSQTLPRALGGFYEFLQESGQSTWSFSPTLAGRSTKQQSQASHGVVPSHRPNAMSASL